MRPSWRGLAASDILLLLPLLLTLGLGAAYLHRAEQHRLAVEDSAHQLAGTMLRAMFERLGQDVRRASVTPAAAGAAAVSAQQRESGGYADPGHALRRTWEVLDSANQCACGPVLPARGVFLFDASGTWVERLGPDLPGANDLLERIARLDVAPAAGNRAVLQTATGKDADGPWLAFLLPIPKAGEPWIVAIDVAVDRLGSHVFAPIHEDVATRWLSDAGAADGLGLTVTHGSGVVVYDGAAAEPAATFSLPLWPDGDRSVGASIRGFEATASLDTAALATLIPGGLPGSPVPLVLTTLLFATVLTGLAVRLQSRRRALLRLREDFVSSVSHELRTPLAQILLYGETLQLEDRPVETGRRAADVIVREARRLIHAVENSLEFVRNQRPETGFDPGPLDVAALVRDVVDETGSLARLRGMRLVAIGPESVMISADQRILRRMLVSLVENAIRYGPHGQEIRIEVRDHGPDVLLRVDDQGPGIPEDERREVWTPFRRGSTARGIPGSGIGLTLVRQGATLHGGTARIDASASGGARFEIALPRGRGEGS